LQFAAAFLFAINHQETMAPSNMPRESRDFVEFLSLYTSPIVTILDYRCHAVRDDQPGEEHSTSNNIVLMRHGAFNKHFGKRHITSDVNQSVFFSKGSTYRVTHPADCGDRGTVFRITPRVLNDIIRELDPTVDEHPERPFPFVTGPCDSTLFWRHRGLVQRLERARIEPMEPLWADVTALQLAADVLEAAFVKHGQPRKRRRLGTDADHTELVESAKAFLATQLGERVTLDNVASAVNCSPFHFARIFQQHTGVPVHRYLSTLRLRVALERVANGEKDLTQLALDVGFSSHAHFSDAFRREFGQQPSEVRREMSKILKV
jgi:AraC family transcriptional regulator